MKLAQIIEARYSSKEQHYKCKNCSARFTKREMKMKQGEWNVKHCPKCNIADHLYADSFIKEAKYASPRTTSFTGDFFVGDHWDSNTTIILRCKKEDIRRGTPRHGMVRHANMSTQLCVVEEVSGGEHATEIIRKDATINLRVFDEGGWEIAGYTRTEHHDKYGDTWTMLHPDIKSKNRQHGYRYP